MFERIFKKTTDKIEESISKTSEKAENGIDKTVENIGDVSSEIKSVCSDVKEKTSKIMILGSFALLVSISVDLISILVGVKSLRKSKADDIILRATSNIKTRELLDEIKKINK